MAALFTATPLCGSVTIQGKRMSILFMTGTLLTVVGTTWVASLFNSWRKRRQVERIFKAKRQQNYENMYCEMCQVLEVEDAEHLIMHCQFFNDIRYQMLSEIHDVECRYNVQAIRPLDNNFHVLLGKFPPDISQDVVFSTLRIIATKVDSMYKTLIRHREGVG